MQGFRCFCFDLNAVPGRNWNEVTAKVLPIDLQFLRIHQAGEKPLLSPCSLSDALLRLIRLYFNQLDFDELVIIDSFPVLLFQPVRSHRVKFLNEVVNIGYCTFKNMWSYGLKVHLAVTESGYILDYLVTLAYSGSRRIAGDRVPYSRVLGDLGYLSKELKERLEAKGIHLWTPLRKNMESANEHNNPAILAIRGTIETRIFVLNAMFDIEHPIVRSLAEWQLEIEQVLLAYHLEFFIN